MKTLSVAGAASYRARVNEAVCTSSVEATPESRKLDEYSSLRTKDEDARLDNVVELQADPTAQAYLIAYGGRRSRPGDTQRAPDRAKAYLVKTRGIDSARLVVVDGGYREETATELWIVPSGALLPTASPRRSGAAAPKSAKPPTPAKRKKS